MREIEVSHDYKFRGRVVNLRVDQVKTASGRIAAREIVEHPGGVGILAVTDDNRVYLVRQYRRPFDNEVWEIPAGKLEYGEVPRECGIRELKEEIGATATNFESLGYFYTSPGFCTEKIYLYLATGLHMGDTSPDVDEYLQIETFPFDELIEKVLKCEIKDGKTVIALLKAKLLLGL